MITHTTRRLVIAGSLAGALSSSAALAGCSTRAAAAAAGTDLEPLAVDTARVALADVTRPIDVGGVVQARATATLTARILAPVREVRVGPGDRVRAGQTLVVLAGDDLAAGARAARSAARAAEQGWNASAAELQAADAGLVLARASHGRVVGLHARRSATPQELDDATASLRSAEARVAAASARTMQAASAVEAARAGSDQAGTIASFTTIAAPFDGTVVAKLIDPGNMASPGGALLRLEDTRAFQLEIRVDESRMDRVHPGDRIPVVLGSGGETASVTGTVIEVSRAIDADARAFLVKIALADTPRLWSGQFGKARLPGTPRRALIVPPAAIVRHGQVTSVFAVEGGVARTRLVDLRDTEVVAGLAASDVVIVSPPASLTDGRRVRVGGR